MFVRTRPQLSGRLCLLLVFGLFVCCCFFALGFFSSFLLSAFLFTWFSCMLLKLDFCFCNLPALCLAFESSWTKFNTNYLYKLLICLAKYVLQETLWLPGLSVCSQTIYFFHWRRCYIFVRGKSHGGGGRKKQTLPWGSTHYWPF